MAEEDTLLEGVYRILMEQQQKVARLRVRLEILEGMLISMMLKRSALSKEQKAGDNKD